MLRSVAATVVVVRQAAALEVGRLAERPRACRLRNVLYNVFGWTACCRNMPTQQPGVASVCFGWQALNTLYSCCPRRPLLIAFANCMHAHSTLWAGLQLCGARLLAAVAAAGTGCLGLRAVLNGWGRQSAGRAARLISAVPLNQSRLVCMPLYSLPFLAAIQHVLAGCMYARTTPRAGLQPARPLPMAATAAGWCVTFVSSEVRYRLLHCVCQDCGLQLWAHCEGAHLQAAAGSSVQLPWYLVALSGLPALAHNGRFSAS